MKSIEWNHSIEEGSDTWRCDDCDYVICKKGDFYIVIKNENVIDEKCDSLERAQVVVWSYWFGDKIEDPKIKFERYAEMASKVNKWSVRIRGLSFIAEMIKWGFIPSEEDIKFLKRVALDDLDHAIRNMARAVILSLKEVRKLIAERQKLKK